MLSSQNGVESIFILLIVKTVAEITALITHYHWSEVCVSFCGFSIIVYFRQFYCIHVVLQWQYLVVVPQNKCMYLTLRLCHVVLKLLTEFVIE